MLSSDERLSAAAAKSFSAAPQSTSMGSSSDGASAAGSSRLTSIDGSSKLAPSNEMGMSDSES